MRTKKGLSIVDGPFSFIWYRLPMQNNYIIPVAIIMGGVLVALGVYSFFTQKAGPSELVAGDPSAVRPIDGTDHILGNPDAAVKFIEYSDVDCPFCKTFGTTMEQIIATYGPSGNVAWVYRHFPLSRLHPNAAKHAEAAECAAEQSDTNAFFRFIKDMNAAAPGKAQFNPANYGDIIKTMGLNLDTFTTCLEAGTYKAKVVSDTENAVATGATGTPYTIIMIKDQPPVSISGAFSYDQMVEVVEASLQKAGITQ